MRAISRSASNEVKSINGIIRLPHNASFCVLGKQMATAKRKPTRLFWQRVFPFICSSSPTNKWKEYILTNKQHCSIH